MEADICREELDKVNIQKDALVRDIEVAKSSAEKMKEQVVNCNFCDGIFTITRNSKIPVTQLGLMSFVKFYFCFLYSSTMHAMLLLNDIKFIVLDHKSKTKAKQSRCN